MHDLETRSSLRWPIDGAEWPLLETLAKASGDALLVVKSDGGVLHANATFVDVWGAPDMAVVADAFTPLLRQDKKPSTGRIEARAGRTFQFTATTAQPSGARVILFRDVTLEASRERAMQDLKGRFRLLSAHTQGIIFEINEQGRFERVWASEASLLARPASEMLGKTVLEILGPEVGAFHDERIRHVLTTGEGQEYTYPLDVPGGRRIFACTSAALPAEGGGRSGIFWIRDITERERMKAALLQAERLASIAMLAAGVAHEINNPLAYMLLSVSRLRGKFPEFEANLPEHLSEELERAVELTHEGLERVRKIVADLRVFSKTNDLLVTVELEHVLAFCVEITRSQVSDRARLVLEFGTAPEVRANQARLGQVFINLIINAAEAITPFRAEHEEVRVVTSTDWRGWACVEVRDTGSGVSDAVREHIFDPFFTTKDSGTGLGLPLCHRLVTEIGGEITFENRSERGSIFRVSLPPAPLTD